MIHFPKIYATCKGSETAINTAYDLRKKFKDKKIYIYKEILHNPYVIDDLKRKDILCIEDLNILKEKDILIIRAHGEPKSTYDELKRRNITYYDATCKNVIRVHNLVKEHYENNYKIIIIGKKTHPEVIGTNGWCNNEAIIIETEDDYKEITKNNKYYVVCQTTTSESKVNKFIEYLNKEKINYEFTNTICNAQKLIQTSSIELAKNMDVMFVIGGKNSSNTQELYNLVKEYTKTYYFSELIEFYEHIKENDYTEKMNIGFTGGASTPKEQINDYVYLFNFTNYYKNKLKEINNEINKYNKEFKTKENSLVENAIDKLTIMNCDGKNLRGCLIDLGYKTLHDDNYSLALSSAYETFETSILIHDDIIDNAKLRRNKKTIPELYKDEFKNYKTQDNTPNSLGICIGDLGFYLTNKIILDNYKDNENCIKVLSYYNNIVLNTIKGEIIDVHLPYLEKMDNNNKLKEQDIMEIYRLKTSWYTVIGPFCLGMILAGQSEEKVKQMEQILEPLGIAFQIKDDILGIYGGKNKIGKSNTSDIEEFKQTILYSYVKINKPDYYKKLLKYYGKDNITEEELIEVQKILDESGSHKYAIEKMNDMFYKAKQEIILLDIKEQIKNILLGLIIYLEIREK